MALILVLRGSQAGMFCLLNALQAWGAHISLPFRLQRLIVSRHVCEIDHTIEFCGGLALDGLRKWYTIISSVIGRVVSTNPLAESFYENSRRTSVISSCHSFGGQDT